MKTRTRTGLMLLAAFLPVASATGQTYTVEFQGHSPGLSVSGTVNEIDFYDATTGVLDFLWFQAFCMEPLADLNVGVPFDYQVADFGLVPNSDAIARLVAAFLASPQNADHASAVQWAIWEITDEILAPWSLTDGNVRIDLATDEPTALLANQYLANLNDFAPATVVYLTHPTIQNAISWNIPEPSTAALSGLAAGLLLVRRRIQEAG